MKYQEEYLSILGIHAKQRTVKAYRFWIESFLDYVGKPEEEIQMDDIARYAKLIKIRYKSKSVELALFVIRNYAKFLNEQGVATLQNVARMRIPKGYSHPEEPITPEEYVAMLSQISARTPLGIRDNMVVRLLYDTGARVGELPQLNKLLISGDQSVIIKTEKTPDARILTWSEDTAVFIRAWMAKRGKRPIIPSTRTMQRIVQKYVTAAGIQKHIHPHLFRHSKAHLILDNGGNVRDVKDILGHRSPISSFMYLRWNEEKRLDRHKMFLTSPKVDKTIQGEYSNVYAKTINLPTEDPTRPQEASFEAGKGWYEHSKDRRRTWKESYLGSERHQRIGVPQR